MLCIKLTRWLKPRFSLRTLFALVTIVAVVIWWVCMQLNWIQRRHAAGEQVGYPTLVSFAASERLHPKSQQRPSWPLQLLGEEAVPVLHCHPGSAVKAEELCNLFPEADIIEIYYPTVPDAKPL